MTTIERTGSVISDIDTDALCLVLNEPFRQEPQQRRRNVSPPVPSSDKDPLQLAVTVQAATEVSSDVTDRWGAVECHPHRARQQRVLRMVPAGQIPQPASLGVSPGLAIFT